MNEDSARIVYRRLRFTAHLPAAYLYTPSHFWLGRESGDRWRVGLTQFGARLLGEMVDHGFEVEPGEAVCLGEAIGWIEGFKEVSDLFCVVAGRFVGGNPLLWEEITVVNRDPQGTGWLYEAEGAPDGGCVDVAGYMAILDRTIDRLATGGGAGQ